MASILDLAMGLGQTISANSSKISSTINNVIQNGQNTIAAANVKAKYQPGQILSPQDAAVVTKAQTPVTSQAPLFPNTQLSQGTTAPNSVPSNVAEAAKGILDPNNFFSGGTENQVAARSNIQTDFNTLSNSLAQRVQEKSQAMKGTLLDNPVDQGLMTSLGSVAKGGQQLTGGVSGQEQPQIAEGVKNVVFGAMGFTGGGAAFNTAINAAQADPKLKPWVDGAFGAIDTAKTSILNLPIVKDLSGDAKSLIGTAVDIIPLVVLHKMAELPFKTSTDVLLPNPETGEISPVKIGMDRQWWASAKQGFVDEVAKLKADPMGYLNSLPLGNSIKDVSGEGATPGYPLPNEKPAEPSGAQAFNDWLRTTPEQAAAEADKGFKTPGAAPMTPEGVDQIAAQKQAQIGAKTEAQQKTTANQNEIVYNLKNPTEQNFLDKVKSSFSSPDAIKNIPGNIERGLIQAKDSIFAPLKAYSPEVAQMWKDRIAGDYLANTKANETYDRLAHIPIDKNMEIRNAHEAGQPTPYSADIKAEAQRQLSDARAAGMKVTERQNYVSHHYANPPEEITQKVAAFMEANHAPAGAVQDYLDNGTVPADIANRLRLTPDFLGKRNIPTYDIAQKIGLTPKYQTVGQDFAASRYQLESSKNNEAWIAKMKESGNFAETRLPGYSPLDNKLSPKQLYAPAKLAKIFNDYFRNENALGAGQTIFKTGAKINKLAMDFGPLNAGVPFTSENAFTIGQTAKSLYAGDVGAANRALISNSDTLSKKYFTENRPTATMMAQEGISIDSNPANWDKIVKPNTSATGVKLLGQVLGDGWESAFAKKTFGSFMNMQSLSTFKSTYEKAISDGVEPAAAQKLAGETTKAWNGVAEDWGQSKNLSDVINTLFLAPRYRTALGNIIMNTAKSITTGITDPTLKMNRRFVAGLAVAQIVQNLAQKQITGTYSFENPPGKETDLKIPYGNGKYVYVNTLPGLLAMPKNVVGTASNLYKGDMPSMLNNISSFGSLPVQAATGLVTNKQYGGKAIFDVADNAATKASKIGSYLFNNYGNPYVTAAQKMASGKADALQTASSMLELPLKFGSASQDSTQAYYNDLATAQGVKKDVANKVAPIYSQIENLKTAGQTDQAVALYKTLNPAEQAAYASLKSATKSKDTLNAETNFYPTYTKIRDLKASGDTAATQEAFNALSPSDRKLYQLLKKKMGD